MLKNSLLVLLATAILVIICFFWVDKPVAFWIYHHTILQGPVEHGLTRIPELFSVAAVAYYFYFALRYAQGQPIRFERNLLIATNSLVVACLFKDILKYCFGRTWALPWLGNNPSLLGDNTYGFFPFHAERAYGSFPSGHATAAAAVMIVFWFCYPKLRWLWLLVVLATAVGLVAMNFHFVSDVIAGTALGGIVGYWTYRISTDAH